MLSAFWGCGKKIPNEVEASLGQEFTLSIGQSASLSGENLTIKFVKVISDSRCPTGATCIWAGEASSLIKITSSESAFSKVLTQSGSSQSKTSFAGYEITFDLQPYPELGKETKEKDYHLHLSISKISTLIGGILPTFKQESSEV